MVCVGVGRNTRGGAPIFYSTKFLPKLHENERNWTGGRGGGVPSAIQGGRDFQSPAVHSGRSRVSRTGKRQVYDSLPPTNRLS